MLNVAVEWLLKPETLEKVVDVFKKDDAGSLQGLRSTLDDYAKRLSDKIDTILERLDQERLDRLTSGLRTLRDALQSNEERSLLVQALHWLQAVAAIPTEGRTGDHANAELVSLANFGMALAHYRLGDRDLVAEKIALAVYASPQTAETFLGRVNTNRVYRRMGPSTFLPQGGRPNPAAVVPDDRLYFMPTAQAPWNHLWLKETYGPITGTLSYQIGFTHYAAQFVAQSWVMFGHKLPADKAKVRQDAMCGRLELTTMGPEPPLGLFAPISGQIIARNYRSTTFDIAHVVQDPYGQGWLLKVLPGRGQRRPWAHWDSEAEVGRLLSADAYRARLETLEWPRPVLVAAIDFSVSGGAEGDDDLQAAVAMVDYRGAPAVEVTVSGRLWVDDGAIHFVETTDADGLLRVRYDDAPPAGYKIQLEEVNRDGMIWPGWQQTPVHLFRK